MQNSAYYWSLWVLSYGLLVWQPKVMRKTQVKAKRLTHATIKSDVEDTCQSRKAH